MNKTILRAEHLSKSYQMGEIEVIALDDVSLEIGEGEFVVILGPSGSGKSTLLNMIGGMDTPTSGKIYLYDSPITEFDDKKLTEYRRNHVGFVFQFHNIMASLTARENIELATELSENPLDIDVVIESVGLSDRKTHFPAQLSGGEQQRVSIARAIGKNPDILLCDEPTGSLDYATGITILSLLRKINREMGKTVVIITHNSGIADMSDRVIRMRSGKIIEDIINTNPIEAEAVQW